MRQRASDPGLAHTDGGGSQSPPRPGLCRGLARRRRELKTGPPISAASGANFSKETSDDSCAAQFNDVELKNYLDEGRSQLGGYHREIASDQ